MGRGDAPVATPQVMTWEKLEIPGGENGEMGLGFVQFSNFFQVMFPGVWAQRYGAILGRVTAGADLNVFMASWIHC